MRGKILFVGSLIFSFSLFIVVFNFYTATASNGSLPTIDKEWDCSSGLSCGDTCQGKEYQLMWKNLPAKSYTFEAPRAGNYSCEIKVTTCCFDYREEPQYSETTDVKLNDNPVGTTEDKWCPPGETTNGDGDECNYGSESECISHSKCYWHSYSWYGNSGGVCKDGGCFDLSPEVRAGKGCGDGVSGDDCCSCYYHSRWCGYCGYDYERYTRSKPFPDYAYTSEGETCLAKSPKHCTDVTYFQEDCDPGGNSDLPVQAVGGGPRCKFDPDHEVQVWDGTRKCSEIWSESSPNHVQNVKHLAYNHFNDLENLDYICCFGHNLDNGIYCVRDSECASGNCDEINNECVGSGSNQNPEILSFTGPDQCNVNENCGPFKAKARDPEGKNVKYKFEWGDGESSETGWVASETETQKYHTYTSAGTGITITLTVDDEDGFYSTTTMSVDVGDSGSKKCYESCTQDSECLSGYCSIADMCSDSNGYSCDPSYIWCNDDCTRKCSSSCTTGDQCESGLTCSGECQCPFGELCLGVWSDFECVPCDKDGFCEPSYGENTDTCKHDCCPSECRGIGTQYPCDNHAKCECIYGPYTLFIRCMDCVELCGWAGGSGESACNNLENNQGGKICEWVNNECECKLGSYQGF